MTILIFKKFQKLWCLKYVRCIELNCWCFTSIGANFWNFFTTHKNKNSKHNNPGVFIWAIQLGSSVFSKTVQPLRYAYIDYWQITTVSVIWWQPCCQRLTAREPVNHAWRVARARELFIGGCESVFAAGQIYRQVGYLCSGVCSCRSRSTTCVRSEPSAVPR